MEAFDSSKILFGLYSSKFLESVMMIGKAEYSKLTFETICSMGPYISEKIMKLLKKIRQIKFTVKN